MTWTLQDRVCVITGANRGIGKATALDLARQGARVAMVARNRQSGEEARKEIIGASGNREVQLHIADLASQRSIRQLAENLLATNREINVLINNAGVITQDRQLTEDGIERQFAVNHLAYFLLTNLLLERLKESAPSRIVNVASNAHHGASIDFNDINAESGYHRLRAYGQSKLANIMFTYELARRLEDTGVTVNALHPGVVNTGIYENFLGRFDFTRPLLRPFMKSTEKGARTPVYLASAPEVERISGKYFVDKKESRSSKQSYDREAQEHLWELSEQMTGLQ
jgi:NAD(P)-dependent dehydrogenase (short-subunit alcohol dehydrogenase family)